MLSPVLICFNLAITFWQKDFLTIWQDFDIRSIIIKDRQTMTETDRQSERQRLTDKENDWQTNTKTARQTKFDRVLGSWHEFGCRKDANAWRKSTIEADKHKFFITI